MAKVPAWEPPSDPDMDELRRKCENSYLRFSPCVVAFDTETEGLEYYDPAFCITLAWRNKDGGMEGHYLELTEDGLSLARLILKSATTWIGHNTKFDLHKLALAGIVPYAEFGAGLIEDTEALAHLDDEHRPKALKGLAVSVLGIEDYIEVEVKTGPRAGQVNFVPREKHELEQAKKWAKKKFGLKSVKDVGYHLLPRGVVVPYAIKDAEFTLMLYEQLRPRIELFPETLVALYEQELKDTIVFVDMEAAGMGVDEVYVNQQIKTYTKKVITRELEIERVVGIPVGKEAEEFNPNSNPQIAAFFQSKGFDSESYDEEHLNGIDHPLAEALLALRGDQKTLNTYFRALKKGTRDGVFHPSIRQHGTVSGRTSSGKAKGD